MWTQLYNDIDKFRFERHCSLVEYWYYKGICIEVARNIFFPNEVKLFILERYVDLNFFERRKLKKFVKDLEKLKKEKEISIIEHIMKEGE